MLFAEHHQIALPVAELSPPCDALRRVGQALSIEDVATLMTPVPARPTPSAVLGQVAIELLCATVFRISEPINGLMAHADRMPFKAHPACDLFGRPTSVEAVFDGGLQIRVCDHLAMDRAPLFILFLRDKSVIAIQRRQFCVRVPVPLDVAVDCRGITA
jgi:hypothetical protein